MNFFNRYALIFLFILIGVTTFEFFSQENIIESKLYGTERSISTISKPIGVGFEKVSNFFGDIYHNYFDLVDIRKKYTQLEQENHTLQVKLQAKESLQYENDELKKILNFKEQNKFDLMVGQIIGYDPSFTYKSIKVNLGQKDGIQLGMGAVSTEGVIGTVIRVQKRTCDLLLVSDPNSNLDALVTRNQSRGVLQGKLADVMQFKYFDRDTNIRLGDTIVTSGLTGAFPQNIPIGTVGKITKNQHDLSYTVSVKPAVNILKLKEVLILKNTNASIEMMRNVAGSEWIEHFMNTELQPNDDTE